MHRSTDALRIKRILRIRHSAVRARGRRIGDVECRLGRVLRDRDGDCAREVEAQFAQGDGQAVHDDGADDEEPDDDGDEFAQAFGIGALLSVDVDARAEILERDVEVEDCGDADGAEEAYEEGLAPFLDLMDPPAHEEHDGRAAEKEDQDAEKDEAVDWDLGVVDEGVPGADGAEPDEDCDVEQHVDGGLEGVVGRLLPEPVVPGEGVAGDEAGQDVVAADHAYSSDDEELEYMLGWSTKYAGIDLPQEQWQRPRNSLDPRISSPRPNAEAPSQSNPQWLRTRRSE